MFEVGLLQIARFVAHRPRALGARGVEVRHVGRLLVIGVGGEAVVFRAGQLRVVADDLGGVLLEMFAVFPAAVELLIVVEGVVVLGPLDVAPAVGVGGGQDCLVHFERGRRWHGGGD